ncbi:PIN domain-containing protein [Candidatus Woesearchaeota archaeon]|nr:PIN domain-containing protein [Candidatus Woesearchaeota archaeon]
MQQKYYLDACIWRDYFENRSDKFRPLGEWALMLIKKIVEDENYFVISDHLCNELHKNYTQSELDELLNFIPPSLIIRINLNKPQSLKAFQIKNKFNIPFNDALHAVLARDNNAILVTRDKHFFELQEELIIMKPEDLV